ncbi:tight adherence protein C [Kineococcus xinjiangensis]|uniref:Tight adherence protein C n=1 Tax=Kineococcus xinjiangensis TaxID=512762 RepID=A0A2S6ICU0_9ACTN|nr:type II secretion system F family protein [Kineococcus xinjiangensis]PPK92019.1 tight adherence protein C [Kineococcus xinjiangensis]
MSGTLLGAGLGLACGTGLCLVVARRPWRTGVDLTVRLAPYLAGPGGGRVEEPATGPAPLRVLARLAAPLLADAAGWVDRVLGGAASVRRRLDVVGGALTPAQFRAQQVLWGLTGAGAGVLLCLLVAARRGWAPVPMVLLVLIAAAAGVLARDSALSWSARRRRERVLAEFPAAAELLALSVGAGEGVAAALERVARASSGAVGSELRRVLGDVRAGAPLAVALDGFALRCDVPALRRFVDAVVVSAERGTPMAEVLRAQAGDVREAGRRQLLEAGGRREIWMLVPVVLLVLPVTVVFAVFPGMAVLQVGP